LRREKVLFAFGTRPEAIKLAPVIKELEQYPDDFEVFVLVTAQHRVMLDQVLDFFGIKSDFDLDVMRPGQSLTDVTKRTLVGLEKVLKWVRPDIILVQGDTTSAFASALAAFYQQIPVGHVEAGLRTSDEYTPYPEEMNRRLISGMADFHFAPTEWARGNLLKEGIPNRKIYVTGNTVIDALLMSLRSKQPWRVPVLDHLADDHRLVLVTAHRRESFGPGLKRICSALATIARRNPDVEIVYPVHPNPNVRKPVRAILKGLNRVHLIKPLDYLSFAHLMEKSYLILTDSGGIQEEAPALGKPVLVLRDKTERPEAIEAGTAKLVGTDVKRIVATTERLLHSPRTYRKMAREVNPFGNGKAARRIVRILKRCSIHRELAGIDTDRHLSRLAP